MNLVDINRIGKDIVGAAFNVRKEVGRGLLEKFYESALSLELSRMDHNVKRQVAVPAIYKGEVIADSYRADIIVDDSVIIEVKAISWMESIECCQLFTYLKLSNFKLGYLINFGAMDFCLGNLNEGVPLKKGIYSIVNNL